jgi:GrpB-like predicted nucleotidyltransferase (UPF0157 family)
VRTFARALVLFAHHSDVDAEPVGLLDVREVAAVARAVVSGFERDFATVVGDADVQHIGATSLPFGHTKGDVDVNVRVDAEAFGPLVAALGERLAEAQRDNWTPTFASFSSTAYPMPLGVQVTVIGSPDDFLLDLRNRMCADPSLLQRYDDAKLAAASSGAERYWNAKNDVLREILSTIR